VLQRDLLCSVLPGDLLSLWHNLLLRCELLLRYQFLLQRRDWYVLHALAVIAHDLRLPV
jgi:hypothetical protein